MAKFIIKRVLWMVPVLLGVLIIVFTINYFTPGDPVLALLGNSYTQEQYDAKAAELGLDQPYFAQLFNYIKGVVTEFDLGTSYQSKRAVSTEILARFPVTLKLGIIGVLITAIIGIPFGIISATHQYSPLDYTVTTVSLFFASMPNFWMALMLVLLFSLTLKWFPATGLGTWKGWVLPALALGLSPIASVTRQTRSSMLEVIRQDYIKTARAKGLSERKVVYKHALKNALIPVVTVIGMQISLIMAGSVIIENIFSIPGVGSLLMSAINSKDYPVIQGTVLMLSACICLMNLLVDLIYGFIDPRIMALYSAGGKRKAKSKKSEAVKEA